MPLPLEQIVQKMIDAGESEENIAAVIKASKPQPQSDSGALPLAAAGASVSPLSTLAAETATNPGVKSGMSIVGQLAGGVEGGLKAGPLGVASGAWAGGKAGWHTGRLVQKLAAPVATALDKAVPYAQALGTASGAQGALDLAQMAEPSRKDIGFLGVGTGDPGDPNHPALLNLIAQKIREKLSGARP